MNRKSIYATLFLTFLLGIGGQTALAHTGGSDAGYRDNQTAASLIQAGEAEGAKILAAQAETSLLHLDEDAVLYATIANQSQTMMARPAVVCTWNGKLVGKTVLTNGLKGRMFKNRIKIWYKKWCYIGVSKLLIFNTLLYKM